MDADDIARGTLKRLNGTGRDARPLWNAYLGMLRACREYVPGQLGIDETRMQILYEYRRQYTAAAWDPKLKAEYLTSLSRTIDELLPLIEQWKAFCAYFDAEGDEARAAALMRVLEKLKSVPTPLSHLSLLFHQEDEATQIPEYRHYLQLWRAWHGMDSA